MELPGRVALVTGGAHRVGRAIALALAAAGANVAIAYQLSKDQATKTVEDLRGYGVDADAFRVDLAEPAEAARLAEVVTGRLGPIDALVNSASAFALDEFPTDDTATWYQTFDVVLHGPFHLTNAVAPSMLQRGGGAVVNIVDLSAWQPWPGRAAHSVAKAALLALTRQVAIELGTNGPLQRGGPRPHHSARQFRTRPGRETAAPHAARPMERRRGGRSGCAVPA